jgi:Protein of unknown function (DUF3225)
VKINDPEIVAEVTLAFEAYERALMEDDISTMDSLFYHGIETVRYGVGEVLYGIEAIREFRKQRGGSPQRTLTRIAIATFGDSLATTNAEFERLGSERLGSARRGRQSQTWVRFANGWRIVSAHVSIEGTHS